MQAAAGEASACVTAGSTTRVMQVIENKARDVGRFAKLLKTLSVTSRDAVFRKVLTRGFCYGNFSESDVTASRPRGKSLKTLEGGVTPANLRRHGPKFLTPFSRRGVTRTGGRSATRGGIGPQG